MDFSFIATKERSWFSLSVQKVHLVIQDFGGIYSFVYFSMFEFGFVALDDLSACCHMIRTEYFNGRLTNP